MKNNIDKREMPAKKIGIVSFPARPSYLTLADIDLRKDFISVGLTPIRSYVNADFHMSHTDDWVCYCEKFRELKEGERTPTYQIELERNGDEIILISVKEI